MKMSEFASSSNLFKAGDLIGQRLVLTINDVSTTEFNGDEPQKPVLSFDEDARELILNKTNLASLIEAFGDDSDDWVGQTIALFTEKVMYAGRRVDGMRVKPKPVEKGAGKGKGKGKGKSQETEDDIPF